MDRGVGDLLPFPKWTLSSDERAICGFWLASVTHQRWNPVLHGCIRKWTVIHKYRNVVSITLRVPERQRLTMINSLRGSIRHFEITHHVFGYFTLELKSIQLCKKTHVMRKAAFVIFQLGQYRFLKEKFPPRSNIHGNAEWKISINVFGAIILSVRNT